ncbi:MAG: isochorismatase family protein, partial [Deltaproteobacteria bacterium]|nr:isochorismatase family protein [Deltaproteobacteria bacterium]
KQFVTQNLLVRDDSVLVVVDVQEKLMPVIADGGKLIDNIIKLLKFSQIMKLPVILTEQDKLGATIAEVRSEILNFNPILKVVFDSFLCDEFVEQLSQMERKTLILAGVEAHIRAIESNGEEDINLCRSGSPYMYRSDGLACTAPL